MHTPLTPPTDYVRSLRLGLALLLTSTAIILTGSITTHLYRTMRADQQERLEQDYQATLARAEYLRTTQNYSGCMAQTAQIPVESLRFYHPAQTLRDQCQADLNQAILTRAQSLAATGQFKNAITELQTISLPSVTAQMQSQLQQLTGEWSNRILQIAEEHYLDPNGHLTRAMEIASAITPQNPAYATAQAKIQHWQVEWVTHQIYWQNVQAALEANQPERALQQAQQITHPYWLQRVQPMLSVAHASREKPAVDRGTASGTAITLQVHTDDDALPLQALVPLGIGLFIALKRLSIQ